MIKSFLKIFFCIFFLSQLSDHHLNAQDQKMPLQVSMVQVEPVWGDVEKNLDKYSIKISKCENANIIILPEFFTTGAIMNKKDRDESIKEKINTASYYEKVVEIMRKWSAEQNSLVMGSTVYMEDGKFYNRLVAAFPDGRIEIYDKHNCFKKGLYTPGENQLIIKYKGYKIATYICYDLRFAEWSRNATGYDIAIYVANWPQSRHNDWEALLRERAIENKATVIGVNCVGEDPYCLKYAGESMAINPKGEIIGKAGLFTEEVVYVNLK